MVELAQQEELIKAMTQT